jgi:hypothetical protein
LVRSVNENRIYPRLSTRYRSVSMTEGKVTTFDSRLDRAKDLADIFELVKDGVRARMGLSRAGLMLGLADMGGAPGQFLGGLYPVTTNVIVLNRTATKAILMNKPELYKPYVFTILLHEYLHTLGFLDEGQVRQMVYEITSALFGMHHATTWIAEDISRVMPFVTPRVPIPIRQDADVELVDGFDRSSFDRYIW